MRKRLSGIILLAAASAASAVVTDFAYYQVILDRQPFGEAPPDPASLAGALGGPGAAGETPNELATKDLTLCAIVEGDYGVRAGFLDMSSKPPKTYYLTVGQNADGIDLLEVDYAGQRAKVRKAGKEEWIAMNTDALPAVPVPGTVGAAVDKGASDSASKAGSSIRQRLEKRRELVRRRDLPAPKLEGEELRKHLEEYQMDLIRSGGDKGPPLPIPLTPEMDAQLVSEGVLPPAGE